MDRYVPKNEIRKIITDLCGNQVNITNISFIGGYANSNYLVRTDVEEDGFVIKMVEPLELQSWLRFEKSSLSGEAYCYKLLREHGIPTLDVIKYSPPGEIINQEYLVTKYIPYIPFTSILPNEDCGEKCYEMYGYYVKKMHQIQVEKFGWKREDNWGEYNSWYDLVCAYTNELLNKTREYSLYDEHFYYSVNEIIKQNKGAFDKVVIPCMVHWDLGFGNVLVNKNEKEFSFEAIIDMGRCIFGDPLWDLVDSSYKPQAFWKGYGWSPKDTLDGIIRSKIYSVLDGIFDAYISLIRFDNKDRYVRENEEVISSIKAIISTV